MRAIGHLLLFLAFCWTALLAYALVTMPLATWRESSSTISAISELATYWAAVGLPLSVLAIACYMASVSECVHDVSRWRPMPREDGERVTRPADAA